MNRKIMLGLLIFILAATSFTLFHKDNSCTKLYIDFGSLNNQTKVSKCIDISQPINALDFLNKSDIKVVGTKKYGNAIVCRVNNLPDSRSELCDSMPSSKSYWAVLIKRHETIPNPLTFKGEWGWAQTGINEVYLNPGDSLGLVFSNNGKVKFP